MNNDELAAYQRAFASLQSAQQHREAQKKLADVEAQLRIANLPPERRAEAQRNLERDRIRSNAIAEESTQYAIKFLACFFLVFTLVFVVGIIIAESNSTSPYGSSRVGSQLPSVSEEIERLRGMGAKESSERAERERAKLAPDEAVRAQVEAVRAQAEAGQVAQEQVKKKEDMQKRLYVFRLKRANDGAAEAQYDLALQYLTGQGVARDITAAKDWLQKAAVQGHKKAQEKLESLAAADAPASPK